MFKEIITRKDTKAAFKISLFLNAIARERIAAAIIIIKISFPFSLGSIVSIVMAFL